jgi:hypothetical protein
MTRRQVLTSQATQVASGGNAPQNNWFISNRRSGCASSSFNCVVCVRLLSFLSVQVAYTDKFEAPQSMADNRSRIESVRRELRAIAQFDANKIHESVASTQHNQQSSRAGSKACLFCCSTQSSCAAAAVLEEPRFTSPSKSSELATRSRCCCLHQSCFSECTVNYSCIKCRVFLDEVSSFQRRANALMKKYSSACAACK